MQHTQHDIDQSITNLSQMCDELTYLVNDAIHTLPVISDDSSEMLHDEYHTIQDTLEGYTRRLYHDSLSQADIFELYESLVGIELKFRNLQGIRAAVITASDWQSPSFAASVDQQAGRQTGKIVATMNDYKRDQHLDGWSYEKKFLKEYIDHPITHLIKVYTTSSGMAAFTTILGFLIGEKKVSGKILMGKSLYFESKIILYTLFPDKIIEFDEERIDELKVAITTHHPSAIFVDSVANSPHLALPDIRAIIDVVRQQKRSDLLLIIDNTGLSVMFQPLTLKRFRDPYVHVIVWESLLKHHQFGMDRVNAGIIYSSAGGDIKLYDYRDHLGTNASDTAVMTLPSPNRKLLTKRLLRHERNAQHLTEQINHFLSQHPNNPILRANVPNKSLSFHGALVTLTFQEKYQRINVYKNFLNNVLKEAKKAGVNIVGGTSFGFSTTRIYIPASRPGQGIPFVRIAVGTEPKLVFEKITNVFKEVI